MLCLCLDRTVHCIPANGGKLRARKLQWWWCNPFSVHCHRVNACTQRKVPLLFTPPATKFGEFWPRKNAQQFGQCNYLCGSFSRKTSSSHRHWGSSVGTSAKCWLWSGPHLSDSRVSIWWFVTHMLMNEFNISLTSFLSSCLQAFKSKPKPTVMQRSDTV